MKAKASVLFLLVLIPLQCCIAQKTQTNAPKIENYNQGEMDIKVTPFGIDNPIDVGTISADGNIHFNWDNDISAIQDPEFFMSSIKNTVGMTFCNDKEIEQNNEDARSLQANDLLLYKDGQQVGALWAGTQKGIEDNKGSNRRTSLILGSNITWVYADSDVIFNGNCSVNLKQESLYDFKEVTRYQLQFEKGWNMMLNTLTEKEDWQNGTESGSLPKSMTKTSISTIPQTMHWYLNYWGE